MKKAIFNSLGSNYSFNFMLRSAFGGGSSQNHQQLEKLLAKHYQGKVTLTYKGREALELALKISNLPKGSQVGISGLTCYVVYRAVENAGYTPVLIDISDGQMHFGLDELKTARIKHKNIVAIIIQNTLGYPADISALQPYCKKRNILIVEDGAHSLGAVYDSGQEVGTIGDMSMFSFSQDKPLDVVAGGALIDRRKDVKSKQEILLKPVSWWQQEINRDYPLWSGFIRSSYPIGVGRVLHFVLKKVHFLAGPMLDAGPGLHSMSPKVANLILLRWKNRVTELEHRRKIAAIYEKNLSQAIQLIAEPLGQPSYLRFPLLTDKRKDLIAYLKNNGIHVGDNWYDSPIAPKLYLSKTNYKTGMCPRAEDLANCIVNLPTHININLEQAEYISRKVNEWHKLV